MGLVIELMLFIGGVMFLIGVVLTSKDPSSDRGRSLATNGVGLMVLAIGFKIVYKW